MVMKRPERGGNGSSDEVEKVLRRKRRRGRERKKRKRKGKKTSWRARIS